MIDDADLFPLARAAITTGQQAKGHLAQYAMTRSVPKAPDFPEWQREKPALQSFGTPLTVETHFEKFATDRGLGPGTRQRWKPVIEKLAAHVGSNDLSRVTKDQIVAWKDALLKEDIQLVTICDSNLSAARSFFGWAVSNLIIAKNPLDEVKIKFFRKKDELRTPAFTDEEADRS